MKRALFQYCCFFWLLLVLAVTVHAQPGSTIYLNKPEKYENRKLGSEKTEERKFTGSRHVYQNMVTHYNYYFNANNKLNGILARARSNFREDFTQLLPFYDFTLDATSQERNEIDTIIYKCTAAVLLHDLRNDWIDDVYLLLGRTYYYRKDFDSALQVFRYINYAFAPKDDGYDIPIGSNISNNDSLFSISTNEHRNLYKKLTTHLPARNEALLWMAHTYTDYNRVNEAASLLEILRSDPQFPARLQNRLHEEIAYWCYTQQAYDTAAVHLIATLKHTPNKQDRSRKEYLIAQLYQLTQDNEKATNYFMQSASHTLNPVQEAYATLAGIRVMSKTDRSFLLQKQRQLLQLAKKDKYILYRDVIYYAAAQVALELHDSAQAQQLLLKSVRGAGSNNAVQRSSSFMLLGDINYDSKNYVAAHNYYDSVEENQLAKSADKLRLEQRKPYLNAIAANVAIIHNQDSLQLLAAMPAAERLAFIKKEIKRLRKLQGAKEDNSAENANPAMLMNMPAQDLFTASSSSSSDWYFNNPSLKASGIAQFNTTWGKRPNADNWRRNAAIDQVAKNMAQAGLDDDSVAQKKTVSTDTLSAESLLNKLPITPEKKASSDEAIAKALIENGKAFQNQLQDYPSAIAAYTELLRRFPNSKEKEEVLLNLYYCYRRTNNRYGEDSAQAALRQSFPNGKFAQMLDRRITPEQEKNNVVTKKYEHIYDLFIEGSFDEAKKEKNNADSTYGTTKWSPQLLYIEAVYYIKQREDSVAIQRLTTLQKDSASPLAEKATTMIDVLRRRKEIEEYLTKLQVTRAEDDDMPILADESQLGIARTRKDMLRDSLAKVMAAIRPISIKVDTVAVVTLKEFTYNEKDSQYVMILLKKVDPVYVNEARNAFIRYNNSYFYKDKITMNSRILNDSTSMILLGPFEKAFLALEYVDKARPNARSRILPWLTPEKYEFTIISPQNLTLLEEKQDLPAYQELLKLALPNKF